jgi:hypothetical protein
MTISFPKFGNSNPSRTEARASVPDDKEERNSGANSVLGLVAAGMHWIVEQELHPITGSYMSGLPTHQDLSCPLFQNLNFNDSSNEPKQVFQTGICS